MDRQTWAEALLEAHLHVDPGTDRDSVAQLYRVAVRHNPKRAQLLVSTVVGKHLPTAPSVVLAAGHALGWLASQALLGRTPDAEHVRAAVLQGSAPAPDPDTPSALVIGFAETASGLGQAASEWMPGSYYVGSTRHPKHPPALRFSETHSHAVEHVLAPAQSDVLNRSQPVVLVDDEFSTGRTVMSVIRALHERAPRPEYVVASLLDFRSPEDRTRLRELAAELGADIHEVALAEAQFQVASAAPTRVSDLTPTRPATVDATPAGPCRPVQLQGSWPAGVPVDGSVGLDEVDRRDVRAAVTRLASQVRPHLDPDTDAVHVLGWEEFMHVPTLLADQLQALVACPVTVSATTQSPARVDTQPGYPLRHAYQFNAQGKPRFAYNVNATSPAHTLVVLTPPGADVAPFLEKVRPPARVVAVELRPVPVTASAPTTVWMTGTSGNGALQAACLRALPNVELHGSGQAFQSAIAAHCDRFHLEPVTHSRSEFLQYALDLISAQKIQLVLPRRGLRTLVAHRDQVESAGARLLAPSLAAVQLCTDKARFIDLAASLDIPVARTFAVTTPGDCLAAVQRLQEEGLRACIKPAAGHGGLGFYVIGDSTAGDQGWSAFRSKSPDPSRLTTAELDNVLQRHAEHLQDDPLLVCEHLPGPELSVDCWSDGTALRRQVARLKHHTPVASKSVAVHIPEVADWVSRLARACGLLDRNCVFNMQFRLGQDGTWRVQEVNPRPSGGVHLSAALGANLLAAACAFELGRPHTDPPSPHHGAAVSVAPCGFTLPSCQDPLALLPAGIRPGPGSAAL